MKDTELVRQIRKTMYDLLSEFYHDNATQLAENAAHELGHDEWLDDETHVVWDCALECMEGYHDDENTL